MAIVVRVKLGTRDADDVLSVPPPSLGTVRGIVRLWKEKSSPPDPPGVPDVPTDKYLVVGDDIGPVSGPVSQRYGQAIQTGHLQRLGGWEALLTERGISIDDYMGNRNFYGDLAVPASLVDVYTG